MGAGRCLHGSKSILCGWGLRPLPAFVYGISCLWYQLLLVILSLVRYSRSSATWKGKRDLHPVDLSITQRLVQSNGGQHSLHFSQIIASYEPVFRTSASWSAFLCAAVKPWEHGSLHRETPRRMGGAGISGRRFSAPVRRTGLGISGRDRWACGRADAVRLLCSARNPCIRSHQN